MKRNSAAYKVLSVLSGIAMLVQPLVPVWNVVIPNVVAQSATGSATTDPGVTEPENPTPTDQPTPTETISPTQTEDPEPTPTEAVAPTVTPEATPTIAPTEALLPSQENTSNEPAQGEGNPSGNNGPPGEIAGGDSVTPTPTETVLSAPETGKLDTIVLDNVDADSLELDNFDPSNSATLTTDKADYAPTDTAVITGSEFKANTVYTITVWSDDEPATSTTENLTTNDQGSFVYAYQLDGTYRPNYSVRVTNGSGNTVAVTSFTDSYVPTYDTQIDTAGPNDEPGQKDLNLMGVDYSQLPTTLYTLWNWDETGWSGANTGDACNLFDTDGDGLANYSLCVIVGGNPATYQNHVLYSCGDARADRCTNPIVVTPNTATCDASVQAEDPFPGPPNSQKGDSYPNDTVGSCEIPMSDFGSSTATLIDVCSYPSQQPNSDPSDCIVFQKNTAKLEVKKVLDPATDPGKFNLFIGSDSYGAVDVGNGGTTGEQVLDVAKNGSTYQVSETAGTATTLTDYASTLECRDANGTGSVVASASGPGPHNVPLAADQDVVCIFTNTRNQGTLIVTKVVENNFGGTKVASDFSFQVNGGAVTPFESDGTNELTVSPGTYTVTEPAVTGYSTSYNNCTDVVVPSGGSATCTITNRDQQATLIVRKVVVNNNGGTKVASDFSFQVNGGAVTPFEADGQNDMAVSAGTYTVTEPAVAGYTTTYDNCTDVVVPNGGTATCTVTNDDQEATLTVIKHVVNDNGGSALASAFTMTINGVTAVGGNSFPGAESPGTSRTLSTVGAYTVTETGPSGYAASYSADCSGAIALGESKTCTVTNDDQAASLTVIKHVVNDDGGLLAADDFTMNVTGENVSDGSFPGDENGTTVSLDAGSYEVTEGELTGYAASYSTDCTGTIAIGEHKTCTVTNDDVAPTLTLVKTVINDNGGTKTVSDFTLKIDDTVVTSGVPESLSAGSYTASELAVAGYVGSAWGGHCAPDGSVDLLPGDNKVCTIVNDDVSPKLIVIKQVVNDNGGSAVAGDFTMTVTGTNVSDPSFPGDTNGTEVTLDEGAYSVSEDVVTGYAATYSQDCTGSITVGETKTCTVTNDDTYGSIIVTKFRDDNADGVKDDNEPVLEGWEMNLSTGAATVSETTGATGEVLFDVLLPDTYTLSETEQPGYRLTGIYCTETQNTSDTNALEIRLGAEETVHCFVGNERLNPILTISKSNDAAGDKSPGDSVTFTITVTATQSAAYNVQVTDLPPEGFTYRAGSWTAQSDVRGDLKGLGITTEPTYASPGVWQLGDMAQDETVTLTYVADISGDIKPGTYKDLAWAFGCKFETDCSVGDGNDVLSAAVNPGFVDEHFVGTQVSIVTSTQSSAELKVQEGEVLGAATELPATGADSFWLMLAALSFVFGLGLILAGRYARRFYV